MATNFVLFFWNISQKIEDNKREKNYSQKSNGRKIMKVDE
jgi:hypothetical protein